jgi:hypothetical protein
MYTSKRVQDTKEFLNYLNQNINKLKAILIHLDSRNIESKNLNTVARIITITNAN